MPRGGPLLGGPLHGAVLCGPLPFGGRLRALRGLRALGALRARLAAVVLVGLVVRPPLGFWAVLMPGIREIWFAL